MQNTSLIDFLKLFDNYILFNDGEVKILNTITHEIL